MKKFNITVNGKTYQVEVEEVASFSTAAVPVQAAAYSAPAPATEAPSKASQPAPEVSKEIPENGTMISAPMPGTIIKVNAEKGMAVKKGDVVIVLEAMKMENDIQSPVDGTVVAVHTTKGSEVNTGEPLVTIE